MSRLNAKELVHEDTRVIIWRSPEDNVVVVDITGPDDKTEDGESLIRVYLDNFDNPIYEPEGSP